MEVGSRILESDQASTIISCPLFSRSQSLVSGVKIVIAHQTSFNAMQNKNIAPGNKLRNNNNQNTWEPSIQRFSWMLTQLWLKKGCIILRIQENTNLHYNAVAKKN